jgi:hypothetical protein
MKNLNGCIVLFFLLVQIKSNAQNDSVSRIEHHLWVSLGLVYSSGLPNLCFNDRGSLQGGQISLTFEKKKQVLFLKAYTLTDSYHANFWGYYNAETNKLKQLGDVSLSYGHRFQFKWGSVIPAAGLSVGSLIFRAGHSDTTYTQILFGGRSPEYHFQEISFYYCGIPLSCRILTSIRHFGLELEVYCNLHKYSDLGFSASIALGRITDYQKRKKAMVL